MSKTAFWGIGLPAFLMRSEVLVLLVSVGTSMPLATLKIAQFSSDIRSSSEAVLWPSFVIFRYESFVIPITSKPYEKI